MSPHQGIVCVRKSGGRSRRAETTRNPKTERVPSGSSPLLLASHASGRVHHAVCCRNDVSDSFSQQRKCLVKYSDHCPLTRRGLRPFINGLLLGTSGNFLLVLSVNDSVGQIFDPWVMILAFEKELSLDIFLCLPQPLTARVRRGGEGRAE